MKSKTWKALVTLCVIAVTIFAMFPNSMVRADDNQAPVKQEIGVNLLANPGFEGMGVPTTSTSPNPNNWTRDTFNGAQYGEIYTPEGWVTWWQDGDFKRPECKVIPDEAPFNGNPDRIYQGYYSGMCFSFFGKINAGYYQVVRNIPAGSVVEASFMAHSWSCGDNDNNAMSCGDPYAFYFRVGIDANGGTDPFSSAISWSEPYYLPDTYGLVGPHQATVGAGGAATMFIQAFGKWPNQHNDAYYDNPVLKIISSGNTPTPDVPDAPATTEAQPTVEAIVPQVTATPRPDGAIVHKVVSGDTIFGIALAYGVDPDQIYQLNNISPGDFLSIGQELTISTSGASAVATPTPEPIVTIAPENNGGTDTPSQPMVTGDKARICVTAFRDDSGDGFRQDGEALIPGSTISLSNQNGVVDTYTTDGISEPRCFENLEPGTYILRHTEPQNYAKMDSGQWNFVLAAGQEFSLDLAYKQSDGAVPDNGGTVSDNGDSQTADPSTSEEAATADQPAEQRNILNLVIWIAAIIVLVLAIAVAVLFFLSRRNMAA